MAATQKSKDIAAAKQNDPTIEQEAGEVIARSDDVGAERTRANPNEVTVRLAHPITRPQDLVYLGLPENRSYGVNDEVQVTREAARALIDAGLVQVDPEDRAKVAQALGVEPDLA